MKDLVDLSNKEEAQRLIPLFTSEDGLTAEVNKVRDLVNSFDHDVSTAAGRKRTISFAAKIATMKSRLDDLGKNLVSDMKKQCKTVDNSRKQMRDALDDLKAEARKPVTEWESEQERIKQEEEDRAEAEKLEAEKLADHEIALLMNEKFDRDAEDARIAAEAKAKEEAERVERERLRREECIRAEAAKKAEDEKNAAILKAQQEKQAAEDRAAMAAKREEEQKALLEKQKREAEEARKIAAENARLSEIQRQEDEKERARLEQEKREANRAHVSKVRREAKEALMKLGLAEDMAKKIVLAIDKEKIPAVTIKY